VAPEIWTNWTGDQRCAPAAVERPASEAEVAAAVARAAEHGRGVRAVGTGHSFTDLACTDGTMLSLERMDRVLDADRASGLVRVQAGIPLHALGARLAELGLALQNQGDIDRQTIAGAISTATHGTGARWPNLPGQVAALRLVTADGDAVELSPESDAEGFLAARVGLGALGVVTEVTLRCLPAYSIRRLDERRPLEPTLDALDELVERHDHFEIYVFPYTDVALVRESERVDAATPRRAGWQSWLQEAGFENGVFAAHTHAARALPGIIPRLNRAFAGLASANVKVDSSHRVYATKRNVRFTEMEYAIPRAAAAEAVRRVLELVRRLSLPIPFPLELRFVPADDAFLSTAHGRESAYVAVHQFRGMEFEAYFRAVEAIMDDYDGRPHWGKRHYQSHATLAPRYPDWDRFQAVRARLDPRGTFANRYVERVLGPVASPALT
jgi:L-gulono-1,4-lactone dehydrogenase